MNVAEILKAIKKAVSPTDWEDILKDAADGDSDGDADDSADGGSDDGDADDKDKEKKMADAAKAGKKPYGDVAYADPKNSKYPIDTAEHVRAAWSYINMDKNQKGMSPAEISAIKGRIVAAWKDKIDPKGPPEAMKAAAIEGQGALVQKAEATIVKANDEDRIVYGWASVATVNGEPVTDLHGDQVTMSFLKDLGHDLIRKTRASKWEHEGPVKNEIVELLVFDNALQKALRIDLGREGLFVGIHVPDDADWQMAKSGNWELSIAARAGYEEI